jgi:hypothetical protein
MTQLVSDERLALWLELRSDGTRGQWFVEKGFIRANQGVIAPYVFDNEFDQQIAVDAVNYLPDLIADLQDARREIARLNATVNQRDHEISQLQDLCRDKDDDKWRLVDEMTEIQLEYGKRKEGGES